MIIILLFILCIIGFLVYKKVLNTNNISNVLYEKEIINIIGEYINDGKIIILNKNNETHTLKISTIYFEPGFRESFEKEGWSTITGVRLPSFNDFAIGSMNKINVIEKNKLDKGLQIISINEYFYDRNNVRFMLYRDFIRINKR